MSSSSSRRLSERSYDYDRNDRSLSRRSYKRSRSSRSRSPLDRTRSSLDQKPSTRDIKVCTSTSYFGEGDKFYISVGVNFEAREYAKLNTACTFYTSHPPSIYMELIGCILIIFLLKKQKLENTSLHIYSKIKTVEDCLYGRTKIKHPTEVVLINFLRKHIKARPGSVKIHAGQHACRVMSSLFELAKSSAKAIQNKTKNYLFLLPKEISDEPGGSELYDSLQKADESGITRDMKELHIGRDQYKQPYYVDDFHNANSSSNPPTKMETIHSPHEPSAQLLLTSNIQQPSNIFQSSNIPQTSSASSPPPGWPSNVEYPLSYNSAVQLILTIISLTEVSNPSSISSSSMFSSPVISSSSLPSSSLSHIALSQLPTSRLLLTTSFSNNNDNNNNITSSISQPLPNHVLSNLPQPSRSGLFNSPQHARQFQDPQNNK